MTLSDWEAKVLSQPGAPQRVAEIEQELIDQIMSLQHLRAAYSKFLADLAADRAADGIGGNGDPDS